MFALVAGCAGVELGTNKGKGTYEPAHTRVANEIPENDQGPQGPKGAGETRPIAAGKKQTPPDDGPDDTLAIGVAVLERSGTALRGAVSVGDTPIGPRVLILVQGADPGVYSVELAKPGMACDQITSGAPLPVAQAPEPSSLTVSAGVLGTLVVGADGRGRFSATIPLARVAGIGVRALEHRLIFVIPENSRLSSAAACGAIGLSRAQPSIR
jgi:hypothetical protein